MKKTTIISPVNKTLLSVELTPDNLIRTVKDLEIYSVTAHEAPHVMDEVGRIRELEFRRAGGGTGEGKAVDPFDTAKISYQQLVVWDPKEQEVVALYRYILCRDAIAADGTVSMPTNRFTPSWICQHHYLPDAIDVGVAVVNRSAKQSRLGLFAAWMGLGALVREYPEIKYFMGRVSLFSNYHPYARDLLLHFLQMYCPASEQLFVPQESLQFFPEMSYADFAELFKGNDFEKDYALLGQMVRSLGELIPPLINSYLRLTRSIQSFGTICDPAIGNELQLAILVSIQDINPKQRSLFIDSYQAINPDFFREKSPSNFFSIVAA